MSHVTCARCGRCEDVRAMQACSHCGDWLCPDCSGGDALCPQCTEDESLKQEIL